MNSKKTLLQALGAVREAHPEKSVEVYFQDEGRFGQHGTLSRVWASRGSTPRKVRQTDYGWVYIFGSVCPARADAHACLMPLANTDVMNLYLEDFSRHLGEDLHALLVMDCAGWHCSGELRVPENITLLHLPPYSPELNPMELVWRELRQKRLGNRVFPTVEDLDDSVAEAWLDQVRDKEQLKNLCLFPWIESVVNN